MIPPVQQISGSCYYNTTQQQTERKNKEKKKKDKDKKKEKNFAETLDKAIDVML